MLFIEMPGDFEECFDLLDGDFPDLDDELDEFDEDESPVLVCTGFVIIHIFAAKSASALKASLRDIYWKILKHKEKLYTIGYINLHL